MNFYDVLAAEKWGGGIPTINFFDLLFSQSISGEQWQVYDGTLPATINANGSDLRQYQVWGNTGGVGDKTVNLFDYTNITSIPNKYLTSDGNIVNSSGWSFTDYIPVDGNVFTVGKMGGNEPSICLYDENKQFISGASYLSGGVSTKKYTTVTGQYAKFARFSYYSANLPAKDNLTKIMLTEGSTAPASFVPFGYGADISTSDGTSTTTTPIYIGNDPLEKVGNYSDYVDYELQKVVRVIKKYVLTGNENWEEITGAYASRKYFRWIFAPINYCIRHVCVSSHFTQVAITTSTTTVGFDVFDSTSVNGEVLAIRPSGVQSTTLEDFKAWLAEQYAAGTPVTVWCTLTVAEEADPPVPLPALPTCDGTTVIDYAGESVAPEKVYFEYQGGKQP